MAKFNEAAMETLSTAFNALGCMGDFEACADPRAYIRTENRLVDACINAGMAYDEDDHHAWAAKAVTNWLMAA